MNHTKKYILIAKACMLFVAILHATIFMLSIEHTDTTALLICGGALVLLILACFAFIDKNDIEAIKKHINKLITNLLND